MNTDLIERLTAVAKAIENRIGKHPDAEAVWQAIEALKAPKAEPKPKASK